jgi:hypothetical protein
LIAALDDPDRNLVAAAEQHLSSIRARLQQEGASPELPPAVRAVDRTELSGLGTFWRDVTGSPREEPVAELTPRARWQEWWNGHSVAQAETSAR